MRYSLVALGALVAGCQISTGYLPAGPNTYIATEQVAPILGGATTAQQKALVGANAFCAQQGRQLVLTDKLIPPSRNPYGPTGYTITFQCLLPGDPELAHGGSTRSPDKIIETRSR